MESSPQGDPATGSTASRTQSALAAVGIVVFLFADVVFRGTSLAPLDYDAALQPDKAPHAPVSLYPESPDRQITDSWGDIGTAAWQFQPSVRFMANAMRTGESPWWNPYEAAGRMGPESLIDVPFSPVTLAAAALGGSSTSITFVLLAMYFVTVYTLIRSLHRYLGISLLASCAAAIVYMLSGFSLGNLYSEVGQPYFLAPMVLLSLLALVEKPTTRNLALCALAYAALFTVTLFPTLVLALIAVNCIVLAFHGHAIIANRNFRLLSVLAAAPVAGFGLVAFLYLPIFESTLNYLDIVGSYQARLTPGYSLESLLSLFTPKHFWQSYRAMRTEPGWPALDLERWVFHMGVLTSLLAASGLAHYKSRRMTAISVTSAVLVITAIGQMFGIPPFTLIDRLPFFSFIRNEYWPALAGIPIAVLVALGIDLRGKWGDIPFLSVAALIGGSFLYLFLKLRMPVNQPAQREVITLLAILIIGSVVILAHLLGLPYKRQLRLALVFGLTAEGIYYMNSLHAIRADKDRDLPESIQWVKSQIASPAGYRVLNLGGSGLMPNWSGGIQLSEVGAIEISILPQYRKFFESQIGAGLFLSFYSPQSQFLFTRQSLSAAGVRFVIVDRTFTAALEKLNAIGLKTVHQDNVRVIVENPDARPRAHLAGRLETNTSAPWNLPGVTGGTATTTDTHLLELAAKVRLNSQESDSANMGTVLIEDYHNTHMRLRTTSSVPAILVLMDSWHPNWKARVDGHDTYVGLVDTAFRGVALPAGEHRVEFSYAPKTLATGGWISLLTLALIIGLSFVKRPLLPILPVEDQVHS